MQPELLSNITDHAAFLLPCAVTEIYRDLTKPHIGNETDPKVTDRSRKLIAHFTHHQTRWLRDHLSMASR